MFACVCWPTVLVFSNISVLQELQVDNQTELQFFQPNTVFMLANVLLCEELVLFDREAAVVVARSSLLNVFLKD